MRAVLCGRPLFIPIKYYRSLAVPLGHMLYIERENFVVGKAPWPGNAMEESAAIKNIVNLSCRLGCLLSLRSSPDSVSQDGLISFTWKERGIK